MLDGVYKGDFCAFRMILDYSTFKPLPLKEPIIVNEKDKMKYKRMA